MKKWKRIFIISAFLSLSFFNNFTFAQTEKVKIGLWRGIGALPTIVAIEKGYFSKRDIEPKIMYFDEPYSPYGILQALIAGKFDAISHHSFGCHLHLNEEFPHSFKFLALNILRHNRGRFGIVVRKGLKISDLSELKGKKLGIMPSRTMKTHIKIIFKGILNPEEDIELIEVKYQNMVEALRTGAVDAIYIGEPFCTLCVKEG